MRSRFQVQNRGDDSGAVLVWVAIITIVLLGISALAVDLGYAYSVKRQLSATSDSAALAGAQEAGLKFAAPGVGGCGDELDDLITAAVNANHAANSPAGSTGDPSVTIECKDKLGNIASGTDATSVTVKVDEASTLDTWFGRVLGMDTLSPAATATARVFGSTYLSGLRPFLVCTVDAKDARDLARAGSNPLFQSYYRKFEKATKVTPTGLVESGASWDEGTDTIETSKNHNLDDGDYVRLENPTATGPDVVNGEFYYVTDSSNRKFKVTTSGGVPVDVTGTGTVDVYLPTPNVTNATWNGTVVTKATHGLADNTEVWVQVVSGSGPADGTFTVGKLTDDTFTLSKGAGPETSGGATINAYTTATANLAAGDACSPPGSTGNWGYSAFDFSGGDNFQLACLIKYGYGGDPDGSGGKPNGTECTDPDTIPGVDVGAESEGVPAEGDQGNNLGGADGLLIKELIQKGQPILLPVGSNWNAQGGNNAEYDGRGALSVKLCGYVLPGNQVNQTSPSLPSSGDYYFDPVCGSQGDYLASITSGETDKDTTLVIQWQFKTWIFGFQGQPSGGADQCPLDKCVASLQLLK